ncbi:hypothetical protein INT45_007973 [Circinella minor]|uniref:DUF6729 domain-containing protein n=1 Tax=Circinella minor TaxID=1195481 RepID=A0A8H7S5F7_9FUNG|nr:hypothetical protein INT45_007973 [Circinella minor]
MIALISVSCQNKNKVDRGKKTGTSSKNNNTGGRQTTLSFTSDKTKNTINNEHPFTLTADKASLSAPSVLLTTSAPVDVGTNTEQEEDSSETPLGEMLSSDTEGDGTEDFELEFTGTGSRNGNETNSNNSTQTELGAIQKYLKEVQKRVAAQRYPDEYKQRTFWIYPKDPYFALHEDLNPNVSYIPRIFLWNPKILIKDYNKKLNCPTCKKYSLKSKGYGNRCRRVVDITDLFYILSARYECEGEQCGASFMANDEKIIRQLPKFLQCQYPAYLTQRGGLSKVVGDMLRPLM